MSKELVAIFKNLGVVVLTLAVGFVLLNLNYWWQQVVYTVHDRVLETPLGEETGDLPADHLRIVSLGIDAPLVYPMETDEKEFQIALQNGVTHYPNTALPGELGNAYFFGHSSDFANKPGGYKTVFALLPRIKKGDLIEISDRRGKNYRYEVIRTAIVRPDQTDVLNQGDGTKKLLTLQTSYPVGTAISRFIVVSELMEEAS